MFIKIIHYNIIKFFSIHNKVETSVLTPSSLCLAIVVLLSTQTTFFVDFRAATAP